MIAAQYIAGFRIQKFDHGFFRSEYPFRLGGQQCESMADELAGYEAFRPFWLRNPSIK